MNVQCIRVGSLDENTYIVKDGAQTILIDPGADAERIESAIGNGKCEHILLTHAHFDHNGAAAYFQRKGAKIYMHSDDVKLLHGSGNLSAAFGFLWEGFEPDVLLSGGEVLDFFSRPIQVMHTPGHTDGSVCYIIEDCLFSGDTLFRMSAGRTDFPSGNAVRLRQSLREIFALTAEYTVYPGHDRPTDLSFEKENNPYA